MKKILSLVFMIIMLFLVACGNNPFTTSDDTSTDSYISVSLTSPANNTSDQDTSITFSWSGTASTYDVYLGTSSSSLIKIVSDLTSPSYIKGGLSEDTTYYWKVIGKKDGKTSESSIWNFKTKSYISVSLTSPANNTSDQDTSITFSWSGTASTYDVYLGTSSSNLIKIVSDLTSPSYIKGSLSEGTTYYWKIIGKKDGKTSESSIWNFKTKRVVDSTNSIGMEFVIVENGTFMMGDNNTLSPGAQPVHQVTITKDFYIGKYEVTQKQWVEVMGSNPSSINGDSLPVSNVSWNKAQEFITKLNQKEGTDKYSLPTEAEWEFVARGGNKSKGYTYSGSNTIDDVAWNISNSNSQTHNVGTKVSNELGIYDMSGNVYEWCSDWYGAYSSDAVTDPTGASSGTYRVIRGGSFETTNNCRVAGRNSKPTSIGLSDSGFRIVIRK